MKITQVIAREIFDSRGWPTVECEIILENRISVTASVPTGVSLSNYESVELLDHSSRMFGRGVLKAVENIERVIGPTLIGQEVDALNMDLQLIDLDGTADKSKLGANAILAVSMALYKAESLSEDVELYELFAFMMEEESVRMPFPFFNVINGGKHANNKLTIQEFIIIPIAAPNFRSSMEIGVTFYHELQKYLESKSISTAVGDEGGFSVGFENDEQAFDILLEVMDLVDSKHGASCILAIDAAASQFYDFETRLYHFDDNFFNTNDMIQYYKNLINKYPIYAIEDGLSEYDWNGWKLMTEELSSKIQIIGDDIFATNIYRIAQAVTDKVATAAIIKPNQIGTIAETLQAIKLCKDNGINTIISHRSGETEDTFIADLAVGTSAGQIKAGAPARERNIKYNRLLRIEDKLTLSLSDA